MRRPHLNLPRIPRPVVLGLAAGLAAAGGSLFLPDSFRSEARILSDAGSHEPPPGRTGVWAPSAPPELPGSREDGPTVIYADILGSARMASRLLFAEYAYPCRSWRFGPERPVRGTLLDYLGAANQDRAMGAFRRLLSVDRNPKSGLLTIGAETRSPELSRQVVRRAVEELRQALVELSQVAGENKARCAWERLEEVRAQYRERGAAFEAFQDANRNWEASPEPNLRFRGRQFGQDLDLWRQILANLTLNHEQALLEARNDTQILLVLDPGERPREKCRPHRALIAFGAAVVTGAASWAYRNRGTVHRLFITKEP